MFIKFIIVLSIDYQSGFYASSQEKRLLVILLVRLIVCIILFFPKKQNFNFLGIILLLKATFKSLKLLTYLHELHH